MFFEGVYRYFLIVRHIHNQAILRGVLGLKTYIEERAVEVAKLMITTNATVRETAKKFGISKSTVHTVVAKWTL